VPAPDQREGEQELHCETLSPLSLTLSPLSRARLLLPAALKGRCPKPHQGSTLDPAGDITPCTPFPAAHRAGNAPLYSRLRYASHPI